MVTMSINETATKMCLKENFNNNNESKQQTIKHNLQLCTLTKPGEKDLVNYCDSVPRYKVFLVLT